MRWLLALHLIAMVCWFAGLFYLPRLFVYHAESNDSISHERFKIMERRLFLGIMTPSALLTIIFGFSLMSLNFEYYLHTTWMQLKLLLVSLLVIFHCYCGIVLRNFANDKNLHGARFYRWLNEIPTLLLISIILLAKVQPTF